MKNYDNWKTKNPFDDEYENECFFCGTPCNGTYCSEACKKADVMEGV
ncbi:MAG: hypothetical protein ACWA5P_01950 [bacterium]